MDRDTKGVDYEDSSDDNQSREASKTKQKKRGRKRLSKLSMPIFGHELKSGSAKVVFPREEDASNPYKMAEMPDDPALDSNEGFTFTFKLAHGSEAIEKAVKVVGDRARLHAKAFPVEAVDKKHQLDVDRATPGLYVHSKYTALLKEEVALGLSKPKDMGITAGQKRARLLIEGVCSVLEMDMSIAEVAEKLRLPYCTLWTAVAKYKLSPASFVFQMDKQLDRSFLCKLPDKETFVDRFNQTLPLLPTKVHLARFLRANFAIDEAMSDNELVNKAKKKYDLVKRCPKIGKVVKPSVEREMAIRCFDYLLDSCFLQQSFVSIFDCCSFSLDKSGLQVWTTGSIRPQLDVASSNAFVHALTAISSTGIDMIMFKKRPIDSNDINTFMVIYLDSFDSRRVIVLDNAAVHRRADLERIGHHYDATFVYNCPNNPRRNPVEWVFGATKAKYRAATRLSSKFCVDDVLAAFMDVHNSCYHQTVIKCLVCGNIKINITNVMFILFVLKKIYDRYVLFFLQTKDIRIVYFYFQQ